MSRVLRNEEKSWRPRCASPMAPSAWSAIHSRASEKPGAKSTRSRLMKRLLRNPRTNARSLSSWLVSRDSRTRRETPYSFSSVGSKSSRHLRRARSEVTVPSKGVAAMTIWGSDNASMTGMDLRFSESVMSRQCNLETFRLVAESSWLRISRSPSPQMQAPM